MGEDLNKTVGEASVLSNAVELKDKSLFVTVEFGIKLEDIQLLPFCVKTHKDLLLF